MSSEYLGHLIQLQRRGVISNVSLRKGIRALSEAPQASPPVPPAPSVPPAPPVPPAPLASSASPPDSEKRA